MKNFKEVFDKNHRPDVTQLSEFFTPEAARLFQAFAAYFLDTYFLSFAVPTFSETKGWTYKLTRSGFPVVSGITIFEGGFTVLDITVSDQASYEAAVKKVSETYEQMKDELQEKMQLRNQKQAERTKAKQKREQEEKEALSGKIVPEQYNRFHWPDKLDLTKLRRLYLQDAKGLPNEELADDIGLCLYIRCKFGKEDMQLLNEYKLRCHQCNAILLGSGDFRQCSCGRQYSYRDYRRSYRQNNMPTGAAAKVFDEYIIKWPKQKDYEGKMRAIDTLLHEFHLNLTSGAVHRPVAMNFMDGTKAQVEKVITELAYQ